jgi:signal transduction histidine kinase
MGGVAALVSSYHVAVAGTPERNAMTLSALLNGLAVLLPWGAAVQAAGSLVALAAVAAVTGLVATPSSGWVISWIVVGVASVTSIAGAFFLDRYRFEAFRRSTLHAEEADIAATLLKVTETLSAHLGKDDMLAQVNRYAVDAVGCDWSSTFLFDSGRGVYRLAANAGSSPQVRETLEQTEFTPDSLPLLRGFRTGTLVELEDPERQALVPSNLLRRTETASALYAPIGRGTRIVGVLVNGYRTRTGPFSEKQRRVTLGIAHATAVALENTRLIVDLQAASRLKSDFVATMSHELRTPLNVIMGYSEMLGEGLYEPGTDAWRETLGRIQRASVELMDLITATLDMGRLEAGRDTVMLGPLKLEHLLGEIAREVEPLVPPGVRFAWTNDLGDEPVTTDGAKVKTVLKNLVGNALKFTTAGTVEVDARAEGDVMVLKVRDTGIGIAPEHLPLIFEMFRQVDGSTTRRYAGVGLGLHIVKRLVTLLGGTITVESTPGTGSTFTVTIPVGRATPQRATGT